MVHWKAFWLQKVPWDVQTPFDGKLDGEGSPEL